MQAPVPYIDAVKNITVNINKLLYEFEPLRDKVEDVVNHGNKVLVQRKFHLLLDNTYNTDVSTVPYTMTIAEQLIKVVPYNSINYRYVMPNTCYNWHHDTGKCCLHIPLITNPGCFFVYANRSFSMPADGTVYIVNNEKFHTFINAGSEPRLHLTFEIL